MKRLTSTITFDSTASRPKLGLVVIYDLEGFSKFFNQPDAQSYVPKVINEVSEAISICIFGGNAYWIDDEAKREYPSLDMTPVHEKFLGDGAMYLWVETKNKPLDRDFIEALTNRLWLLKSGFRDVVKKCHD